MMSNENFKNGISVIIFQKDAGIDLLETFKTVLEAKNAYKYPIEIISIDDGSAESVHEMVPKEATHLRLEKNLGVSGAILQGAKLANYKMLLAVPGTNMYQKTAYLNVFETYESTRKRILGFRSNLFSERPILKYFASKILLKFFKIITHENRLQDIHGLNLFETSDVLEFLPENGGHGGQLQLLAIVLKNHDFVSVDTPIFPGHKNRISATRKDSRPSMKAIRNVVVGLLKIIRQV